MLLYALAIPKLSFKSSLIFSDLKKYAEPKIKTCLNSFKESLERKGYSVSMKNPEISIELVPDNVLADLNISLSITKGRTETYEHIRTGVKSKIYNFVMIASSISNWEARYGDSETTNYMIYYPNLKVEKKKQGDGTTVYILTDRTSLDKFMFASRSIYIPAGITGY